MRVFAALPLPPRAVESLSGIVDRLRARVPRARWVSPDAFHLTMHFFGEVEGQPLSDLHRAFEDPRLTRSAVPVRFADLGQFPPRGSPRVLWIGLTVDGSALHDYWKTFESVVAPLGWESDKRGFAPHVTIARAGNSPVDGRWSEGIDVPEFPFFLGECVLFQSVLSRDGARYVPLKRIVFEGGSE